MYPKMAPAWILLSWSKYKYCSRPEENARVPIILPFIHTLPNHCTILYPLRRLQVVKAKKQV